jgi:hypothetical protein
LRLASSALAHNPDTSYARVTISSNALEFKFTYDIVTLLRITPLDANADQRITRDEINAQAEIIQGFLRRHILLEVDSTDAAFDSALPATWPEDAPDGIEQKDYHQRLITFTFTNASSRPPGDVALTFDFFEQFGERHNVLGVFVHGGEELPVIFTRFEPDFLYDLGYDPAVPKPDPRATITNAIAITNAASPAPASSAASSSPRRSSATETVASSMRRFLWLGMEHIFHGYDHLLFLLGLIVIGRFLDLVKIVTSFTIAHTITLLLAAFELVNIDPPLIETAIALTIVYVAAENLWTKEPKHRWVLTFAFGLVHGFGFANLLRDLDLPTGGFVRCLVSFNVGVEIGQLVIVALVWPLITGLNRWKHAAQAKAAISVAILVLGLGWLVDRALGLGFMPF